MQPYFEKDGIAIYHGQTTDILPKVRRYHSVVTDPPYPCIGREYGTLTEDAWHEMMKQVVASIRSHIHKRGSAVFILQPNSEKIGRMRPWLWDFMSWTCKEWNQVQDAWWWNHATIPATHSQEDVGLLRGSIKACVWLGNPECYRNQGDVLLPSTMKIKRHAISTQRKIGPSGVSRKESSFQAALERRGGSTPYNLLVCTGVGTEAGGHPAATPLPLALWWARYITPKNGTLLDPFCGSGTMLVAAHQLQMNAIGIEKEEKYCEIAAKRISKSIKGGGFLEAQKRRKLDETSKGFLVH